MLPPPPGIRTNQLIARAGAQIDILNKTPFSMSVDDTIIRDNKRVEIIDGVSRTGGGSSPSGERPTRLIALAGASGDAGRLERRLRAGDPPVVGRMHEGRLLLDLRTVLPEEEATLVDRLTEALAETD